MTSTIQTPSSFSTISRETRIYNTLKIIKDINKTKYLSKNYQISYMSYKNYEDYFKSLTQKQKNNIKKSCGCFNNVVHSEKPIMISKIMTNKEFIYRFIDFDTYTSNNLIINFNIEATKARRIMILEELYNNDNNRSYDNQGDFDLMRYEASLIHNKNIIVKAFRKYIKIRKEKASIIENAYLKCKYSPYTKIGQKYINKLYDENFEEQEEIEGENIMICNNNKLLEMKKNRFKIEVNEMRKYLKTNGNEE